MPDAPPAAAADTLTGVVTRIVYVNAENGYTVAGLMPAGSREEITIVGNLSGLQPQERLVAQGTWKHDRRYGRQFAIDSYESSLPTAKDAIEKYLASGVIKGIGQVYAKRLVERFGEKLFEVMDTTPERLAEVEGIGPKRRERLLRGWEEHRALRELMLFLQRYGVPQGLAPRIYREYGVKAVETIRANPYQLALDVRGIAFKSADAIAQRIGIPHESIDRAKAGALCLLQEKRVEGHCFWPVDDLVNEAAEGLAIDKTIVVRALNALKESNHIALEVQPDETRAVYLRRTRDEERECAQLVLRLCDTGKMTPTMEPDAEIAWFEAEFKFELADAQRAAIRAALRGGVLVITGGPGTGKTTIVRAILKILDRHGVRAVLAAPTGRAAKRLSEVTRREAGTIHRLLQFDPSTGRWTRNAQNPLRTDYVLVDEASMVDLSLFHALLMAVPPQATLIMIGDVDQLPSVGPGSILRDLIASGVVPVARLDTVFRQARRSLIIQNAHQINAGQMPPLPRATDPLDTDTERDFIFMDAEEPEALLGRLRDLVTGRLPGKFGFHPIDDIQVLSPMRRGQLGTINLNTELQKALNPRASGVTRGGMVLKVGDKVIQRTNDYDKEVFNGDVGIIAGIDKEEQMLSVRFDGREVFYEFPELDDLDLAYAVSVHKSQGSEYKCVVVVLHTAHFVMLQRNLLYTAVTRGRKLVVLLGSRRAVSMAVKNSQSRPRWTGLAARLRLLRERQASPVDL